MHVQAGSHAHRQAHTCRRLHTYMHTRADAHMNIHISTFFQAAHVHSVVDVNTLLFGWQVWDMGLIQTVHSRRLLASCRL